MEFLQKVSQQLFELENTDIEHPMIVLGQEFEASKENDPKLEETRGTMGSGVLSHLFHREREWNPKFLERIHSLLHFTYRTRFQPIPKDPNGPSPMNFGMLFRDNPLNSLESAINHPDCFCSDIGWGCMIRTGQTMLGNALMRINVGPSREMEVIRWFEDKFSAPFSLHNFVQEGQRLSHKPPGEWFGPSATSRSIQCLIHKFPQCGVDRCVISTDSADVYEEDISPIFEENPNANILLLLGVKLGLDNVNARYWADIKQILNSTSSVGISGGRPSSSLYFFGYQGDYLLYLDPHTAQLDLAGYATDQEKSESVHSTRFNKIHLSELDPSMLIGVLIKGSKEWDSWKLQVGDSQLVHVSDKRPNEFYFDGDYNGDDDDDEGEDGSMGSITSRSQRESVIEGDYVDVAPMLQHAGSCKDDEFQDVKCKNQKILVVGDHDSSTADTEVERVLVEQETIPLVNERGPPDVISPV